MPNMLLRAGAALTLAGALLIASQPAHACGGCFHPPALPDAPAGSVQTVTDHRMVLALSATQTTLWDQFSYAGAPSEFSWILPIRSGPEVRVELADPRFLATLDNVTAPTVRTPQAPRRMCPLCASSQPSARCGTDGPYPFAGYADAAISDGAASYGQDAGGDSSVTVYQTATVGPYQITVLTGSDPMALRNWLTANNYVVPASLDPVLAHYIDLRMDFVAVRLRPAEGEQQMAPIRVTAPGLQPLLPLRMIAAGISDHVGLLLLTLSTGRMETVNFPNASVHESDLVWDYNASPAGLTLRQQENALSHAQGDRAWITEMSGPVDPALGSLFSQQPREGTSGTGDAGFSPDGGAGTSPGDDWAIATGSLGGNVVITRLRADLPVAALDRDLTLGASALADRSSTYYYGTLRNTPTPPACTPCPGGTTEYGYSGEIEGPYSGTYAANTTFPTEYHVASVTESPAPSPRFRPPPPPPPCTNGGLFSCTVSLGGPGTHTGLPWTALVLGAAGLALAARRRRRR
jgi:hypothetical protein